MNRTEIKDKYRVEVNKDVWSEYCCENPAGSYSDEYVKWLEEKLSITLFQKNGQITGKNREELMKLLRHYSDEYTDPIEHIADEILSLLSTGEPSLLQQMIKNIKVLNVPPCPTCKMKAGYLVNNKTFTCLNCESQHQRP